MQELALFPLNTVLFPGMPLNLYIFEERYKLMITRCIESRHPFGVVLIANHHQDTSPNAVPYSIGCTAQITQVQPLGGGEMNITAIGRERFHIRSIIQNQPYLVAETQPYPFAEERSRSVSEFTGHLRGQVKKYLDLLRRFGQINMPPNTLPESPMGLAFLAAVILQAPVSLKQDLLESQNAEDFMSEISKIYHRELMILKVMATPPEGIDYHDDYSLS